jgi:hypothetical protein
MGRPDWVSDVSVGDWIAPRLRNLDGTVASAVPAGFDAYARVLHPVDPTEVAPDRWSDVCAATGATPHALMQWRAISRTEEVRLPSGSWTRTTAWYADGRQGEPIPPAFPPEVLRGPRLRLPHRDHLVFTGPLEADLRLGDPRGVWWQSPNLFWPGDRSWCVASEIDFDSTLVGGSRALIDAVLAHPRLEAWPVAAGDSLAWDADTINSGRRP